jgi:LEA14-like dessication related protein
VRPLSAALINVAVTLALITSGCGHAKKVPPPPAPIPVVRPTIALEKVQIGTLGFGGLDLVFGCRIENPNLTPVSVTRVSYALALEGRAAAAGALSLPLAIGPAGPEAPGTGSLALPVTVRFKDVPSFGPLLSLGREAAYSLTGDVTFSTPAGPVSVPLSQAGTIPVPRAPRFRVERLVMRSATHREVVLEMAVQVHNPNPFAIPGGRIDYGLFMSDREVVRTGVQISAPIAGGETATVVVPIRISVVKAGTAVARMLLPFASLDVDVRGQAVFDGVPVPLDLDARILPAR